MNEQKNLLAAFVISAAVLFGFQYFAAKQKPTLPQPTEQAVPTPAIAPPTVETTKTRSAALAESTRIAIKTDKLSGSINLKGGRLDDVVLNQYKVDTAKDSHSIVLFSPEHTETAYFADFGWTSSDAALKMPGQDTVWSTQDTQLDKDHPVTLTWKNDQGIEFKREISVDANYLITIKDTIANQSSTPVTLYPFSLIARSGAMKDGIFLMHEGPIGVFDNKVETVDYSKVEKDRKFEYASTGGWMGFTDKYWLAALIPGQKDKVKGRFTFANTNGVGRFQADYLGDGQTCAPKGTVSYESHIFTGAKVVTLLDGYEKTMGVPKFDKAVDFGWFYFLTKPTFYLLNMINEMVKNFGISILILTVIFKLALFPLANKSYVSMNRMKKLQPKVRALQDKYGEDKVRMNQELMELYKREKVNPVSGCLPVLVQAPILFALYKVFYISIEMRHAPFIGWIHDMSAPDPTTFFNLFGLLPFTPPSFLMIGILPLILGGTMFIQQKMSPAPADPTQEKVMLMMPIMFTFMLAQFPAGLVIYWIWSNLLSMLQQWFMMKRTA